MGKLVQTAKWPIRAALYCGLVGVLSLLTGCARIRAFRSNPWVERIITYAPGLTWTLFKWTVGCGVIAIPIALFVFFGLRKVGGFRWKWKHARYARILTGVLILLITVSFGALIGLNEGIYRGLRDVVNSPKFKEELRPVGGSGADVVGAIYIIVARTPVDELTAALKEEQERLKTADQPAEGDGDDPKVEEGPSSSEDGTPSQDPIPEDEALPSDEERGPAMLALEKRIEADLETFRKGEWEVDVAVMKKKARETRKRVFDVVLPDVKGSIREEFPGLKQGRDAKILDWFIDTFGEALLTKLLADELERAKLRDPIVMIWEGLEATAKESGNPKTITYDTLCGYLPSRVLYACAVYPTKLAIRGNQTGLLLIWLLIIVLSVVLFQVTEFIRARNLHGRFWAWLKTKIKRDGATADGPIITPAPSVDRAEEESGTEL